MSLIKALSSHPHVLIHLDDGSISYEQLIEAAANVGKLPSPYSFTPEWTLSSLATLIAANDQDVTLVMVPKGASAPSKIPDEIRFGHILLRTSGTEGPPKWVVHNWNSIHPGLPIDKSVKHLGAALLPSHAAALEVLAGVFKAGIEFSVGENWRKNKQSPNPDAVAGPPQHLGFWLAMNSQHAQRLTNLKIYYCCADAYQPQWETKRVSIAPHIKIIQVYGCSEAWQAPTETSDQFPWLIRFTNNQWRVENGKVLTTSQRLAKCWLMSDGTLKALGVPYAPGDFAIEERAGWWRLKSARHEVASFWGQKINLLELEALALNIDGVVDVTAVAKEDPLAGQTIELHIVPNGEIKEEDIRLHLRQINWPFPIEALVPVFGGTLPEGKKRRRA